MFLFLFCATGSLEKGTVPFFTEESVCHGDGSIDTKRMSCFLWHKTSCYLHTHVPIKKEGQA